MVQRQASCCALCVAYFFEDTGPTVGAAFLCKVVEVDGTDVKLELWGLRSHTKTKKTLAMLSTQKNTDTAGPERFRFMAPMYYRNAQAVIVGFDVTRRETMNACDRWVEELRTNVPDCVVVAVGNKIDLAERREISTEEARAHFEEKGVPYFETSAKTGEGVNELFDAVVRMVIERITKRNVDAVNNENMSKNEEDDRQ